MANLLLILLMEEEDEEEMLESQRVMRGLRDSTDPFSASDEVFMGYFRLTKEVCHMLINDLEPKDNQQTSLPFGVRFFCCIFFYAQGSYQKAVGANYLAPLSQPGYISGLLNIHKSLEVRFPTSNEQQMAIKTSFYSKFGIKGVIGAIDCTHIAIVAPPKNDIEKPVSLYMNRKGYYSLNVEAVCDDGLKLLAVNASFPGSCHDSGIWTTSPVRTFMEQQQGVWLLGDQGYPLEPWLLTPLAEPATEADRKYNRLHIKARNVVKRCFGVLKTRFRCLSKQRVLHYSPEMAGIIINACAILHNIMVDRSSLGEMEILEDEEVGTEAVSTTNGGDLHRQGVRVRQRLINSLQ